MILKVVVALKTVLIPLIFGATLVLEVFLKVALEVLYLRLFSSAYLPMRMCCECLFILKVILKVILILLVFKVALVLKVVLTSGGVKTPGNHEPM